MGDDNGRPSVLVTRPAGEAARQLRDRLRGAGYRAHCQPLLELQPLQELPGAARRLVMDLDQFAHVIFISRNAVRFGLRCIDEYWPQLPVGIDWYAVGESTAQCLRERGIEVRSPGDEMSSEGLLCLPGLAAVRGERVLIVKGEGGRETLRRELAARGARVDELACYRRRCPALPDGELAAHLRRWQVDTVLLSSGEGLANFIRLLSPAETSNFKHLCLIVPSGRVAALAREAGFEAVVTAHNASDAAMMRALERHRPSLENK